MNAATDTSDAVSALPEALSGAAREFLARPQQLAR